MGDAQVRKVGQIRLLKAAGNANTKTPPHDHNPAN